MEIVRVEELTFSYPDSDKKALNKVSFSVKQGEFITICGRSGCGKTTLLRHIKTALTPYGEKEGNVYYCGEKIENVKPLKQAEEIGFIMQSPDNQIVCDRVWHEIAFSMENSGFDMNTIRLRTAETAGFFGLEKIINKKISQLSGGEKQLVNLASVMVLQPKMLILDEPTSQLDPMAATEFLSFIEKINRETGTTVIITEHRLEELFPLSDRVFVMTDGEISFDGKPEDIYKKSGDIKGNEFIPYPAAVRIFSALKSETECPLTVRDARRFLDEYLKDSEIRYTRVNTVKQTVGESVLKLKNVTFSYEKGEEDIIRNLSLDIPSGSCYCILGSNGSGKTTLLKLMSGILKPQGGKVIKKDRVRIGYLPQNVEALFTEDTVEKDIKRLVNHSFSDTEKRDRVFSRAVELSDIGEILSRHPFDLSGGEKERAGLGKVLASDPDIILLDEPTKGMDWEFKLKFVSVAEKLKGSGKTVVIVSHDIEFCCMCADYCVLLFDGEAACESDATSFFSGNSFYTSAANRISRHVFENAVTCEDVIELCKKNKKT